MPQTIARAGSLAFLLVLWQLLWVRGLPDYILLLLHGFPELAYSWRKVMLPLAEADTACSRPTSAGTGSRPAGTATTTAETRRRSRAPALPAWDVGWQRQRRVGAGLPTL